MTVFDLQPTLTGTLVELRPLRPEDFDELCRAASDPLIWEQHPEPTRHEPEVFQRFFDGAIASKGALVVIDRKSGRIIGSSRYWNLEPHDVEIGWTFLERAYWGGEYNGEMKRLMIEHAFRFVERVVFVIGETNLRSQRAVKKIGATFFGPLDRTAPDGTIRRNVVYAITR
jgi:N-acetyltransferase